MLCYGMCKDAIIRSVKEKYRLMSPSLSERTRRLWCAVEARQLGWGGISIVQKATGLSIPTIRRGIKELEEPVELSPIQSRLPGGGRKKLTERYPDIPEALDTLIDPVVRGDPESPLRWTCKSTRLLATELNHQGYEVGPSAVRFLLHELEYSLQGHKKTREGKDQLLQWLTVLPVSRRINITTILSTLTNKATYSGKTKGVPRLRIGNRNEVSIPIVTFTG